MDLVFGVCMKYFKDSDRSKDAVMDIFEELVVKLKKHEVENFKGWLHVLSRNYCLMELRSNKNGRTTEFRPEFMQSNEDIHLNVELLEKEENFKRLERCLELLTIPQKQAVQLFYLEKKCYKEIADLTGLEWNMVRSYIQNGRRNLKNCMDKRTAAINAAKEATGMKRS